jgi:hypothetical protein
VLILLRFRATHPRKESGLCLRVWALVCEWGARGWWKHGEVNPRYNLCAKAEILGRDGCCILTLLSVSRGAGCGVDRRHSHRVIGRGSFLALRATHVLQGVILSTVGCDRKWFPRSDMIEFDHFFKDKNGQSSLMEMVCGLRFLAKRVPMSTLELTREALPGGRLGKPPWEGGLDAYSHTLSGHGPNFSNRMPDCAASGLLPSWIRPRSDCSCSTSMHSLRMGTARACLL